MGRSSYSVPVRTIRRHWYCGLAVLTAALPACATGPRPGEPVPAGWSQTGTASWYGRPFHGRQTANGETYDMEAMTAAHKRLPFGSVVRVENLDNGRVTEVRINDRGPFVGNRIIDLSRRAARVVGMIGAGTARVRLTLVGQAATRCLDVQVGAFADPANAEALRHRLADAGHRPRVIQGADGISRVFLGPYWTDQEAGRVARRLKGVVVGCRS